MLDDPVVLSRRLDHLAPLPEGVASRFLNVNVFARLAGPNRRRTVPMIGRSDHHRVHTVHYALVMRGCPVGVSGGESPGGDDAIAHFLGFDVAADDADSVLRPGVGEVRHHHDALLLPTLPSPLSEKDLDRVAAGALKRFDTDGSPIVMGEIKWTKRSASAKKYQTPYGEVEIERNVYQTSKGGRIYCPLEAAARIDFGGGWTDTPPYSIERGGTVLNAAITLNRAYPIVVEAQRTAEPKLVLHSADIEATLEPAHVGEVLASELNAVSDNPVLFPETGETISAGQFHGQPISMVLDYLTLALATIGNISERRIEQLVNPAAQLTPTHAEDPAPERQVLARGQLLVDGHLLGHHP